MTAALHQGLSARQGLGTRTGTVDGLLGDGMLGRSPCLDPSGDKQVTRHTAELSQACPQSPALRLCSGHCWFKAEQPPCSQLLQMPSGWHFGSGRPPGDSWGCPVVSVNSKSMMMPQTAVVPRTPRKKNPGGPCPLLDSPCLGHPQNQRELLCKGNQALGHYSHTPRPGPQDSGLVCLSPTLPAQGHLTSRSSGL